MTEYYIRYLNWDYELSILIGVNLSIHEPWIRLLTMNYLIQIRRTRFRILGWTTWFRLLRIQVVELLDWNNSEYWDELLPRFIGMNYLIQIIEMNYSFGILAMNYLIQIIEMNYLIQIIETKSTWFRILGWTTWFRLLDELLDQNIGMNYLYWF